MNNTIIPVNTKGKETDLDYTLTLPTAEAALNCFNRACKRLLNPPVWHELCGALSPDFRLIAANGQEAHRLAAVNDHFRIDIPGPGNTAGEGYDWVKVEAIEDNSDAAAAEESFAIRVRPCTNPNNPSTNTAHFFEATATSTFVIRRKQLQVTAEYHGRNELPNTDTEKTMDNIRNAAVAAGGFVGLSELQWHALIKGLLQEEIGG